MACDAKKADASKTLGILLTFAYSGIIIDGSVGHLMAKRFSEIGAISMRPRCSTVPVVGGSRPQAPAANYEIITRALIFGIAITIIGGF